MGDLIPHGDGKDQVEILLLEPCDQAEAMKEMSEADKKKLLREMSSERKAALVACLPENEQADVLGLMLPEVQDIVKVLLLSPCEAAKVLKEKTTEEKQAIMGAMSIENKVAVLACLEKSDREDILDND